MATTYQQLLHSVALRANALKGAQPDDLETFYAQTTLAASSFKSADFPFTHFRDAILQGEEDMVGAIAMTGNHPWREFIRSTSAALTSESQKPIADSGGKPVIGTIDEVADSADGTPCVEMPIDVIVRYNRNAGSHYLCPVYYYKFEGHRIYHTRPSVVLGVCIYSRADQLTAFDANGNMLLPDTAEPGVVARALSYLFRDGVYAEQAAMWRKYSDDALAAIRGGTGSIVPKTIPVPVTEVKAA